MLNAAARRLLWVNGLFALANSLSGLFTNVYLWRLRPGLLTPVQYNLFVMLTLLVVMPPLGAVVKRRGAVLVSAAGTGLYALFYLLLLVLKEQAAFHLAGLGILMGLAVGFWALAGHVLVYDVTEPGTREAFYNRNGLWGSLAGLLAPLVAGWLMGGLPGLLGYRVVFVVSFLLFAASAWLSLGLSSRRKPAPYAIGAVLPGRDAGWHWLLGSYFILGLRDGLFSFVVSLLVFLATGGEQRVGNFTFLTSAVGLAAFWLAGRYMTTANRDRLFFAGGLLLGAASGLLALGVSWPIMLAHGLLNAVANPLWSSAFGAVSFDVIKRAGDGRDLRIEMIAAREIPLNLGRVITLTLVMNASPVLNDIGTLQTLLALLGLAFPAAWWCMHRAGKG
jgi:YQGE family putative transporter